MEKRAGAPGSVAAPQCTHHELWATSTTSWFIGLLNEGTGLDDFANLFYIRSIIFTSSESEIEFLNP